MSSYDVVEPIYPWFGSKRRVADVIWREFGDVQNFIDPFLGTCSVLLKAPWPANRLETVNDLDHFITNVWRSIKYAPEATADAADWIVSEADLAARHYWLVTEGREKLAAIINDPRQYDAEIAGWWLWGQSAWIGSGWCAENNGGWALDDEQQWVRTAGKGVNRQRSHLGDAGKAHNDGMRERFTAIANRLRYVRVCCGDWQRVLGPSVTTTHGVTAVILDPPYASDRTMGCYAVDSNEVSHDVREWALANGDNPKLRIALCGHEGEHDMPDNWRVHKWSASGGYSGASEQDTRGKENKHLERIWFSPACVGAERRLFA